MAETRTPKAILNSTDPMVSRLIDGMLKIEQEYQHYQNLPADKERDISDRLLRLIKQEIPG